MYSARAHAIAFALVCWLLWSGGEARGGPCVEAPVRSADLGVSLCDRPVATTFALRNAGDATLRLAVTKTSCGCAVAMLSGEEVAPGAEATVELRYRLRKERLRVGPQSFTALVRTNDPARPELTFELKVRLVRPVETEPRSLDLGALEDLRTPVTAPLDIVLYREVSMPQILSVVAPPPLKLKVLGDEAFEFGVRRHYEVSLDPRDVSGVFRGSIMVRSDAVTVPIIEVPVQAAAASALRASPETLLFGLVKPGAAPVKTVTLTARDSCAPERALASDPRIQLQLEPLSEPGRWKLLATLSGAASAEGAQRLKATVEIRDAKGGTLLTLPVSGILLPSRSVAPPKAD